MSQLENQSAFKADTALSPGKLLQAARESQQLTYTDVANKLRLSEQYVKDLESDDYGHIGARIYARGYLLNYAKLLGLPTEEIMRAIQSSVLPDENVAMQRMLERTSTPINIRLNPYGREKRNLSKWFGGIFLILLVLVVVVWWQNQKNHLYSTVQTENPLAPSSSSDKSKNEQSISLMPASGQSSSPQYPTANPLQSNHSSSTTSSNMQNNPVANSGVSPNSSAATSSNVETSNVIVSQQPISTNDNGNNASPPNTTSGSQNLTPVSPLLPAYQQNSPATNTNGEGQAPSNASGNTLQGTASANSNNTSSTVSSKPKSKNKKYSRRYRNSSNYSSSSNRNLLPPPGSN